MKKIKVFKTNNNNFLKTEREINTWIEEEKIDVHQISVANGYTLSSSTQFGSLGKEIEMFVTILYSEDLDIVK
ncbi:hypothetical protein D3C71_1851200 [compost metagenome]